MNTQNATVLLMASMVAFIIGCGKTEKASVSPSEADETKPAAVAQPQMQTPASTAATNAGSKLPSETVAMAAETAPAPVKADAPKAAETSSPVPGISSGPSATAQTTLAALSRDQVGQGLLEALGNGLRQAIARLGHDGGFLTNLNVRIPMPEKLRKVESALRAVKQEKLADDFVATMNHAAEQAVPEAGAVFADALKQMTIEDAKSILTGADDAATQYFQRTTQTNLYARFYPIVKKATEQTGVTASYKNMVEKASVGGISQRLGGLGGAVSGSLLDKESLDIDAYVTDKALGGLFKMVAEEEKQIRQNPAARTTDLLQKVFGALKH